MTLNLTSSDFELFALPEQFAQDGPAIEARWKEMSLNRAELTQMHELVILLDESSVPADVLHWT